ncbi:hypothetical protein T440DRAFT_397806 [Plenodomus tracheiphilus IPT5]|uniref:UBZ4-type domain-containing protein n=1 Tax=Plenodomus tracheiphilus IPT5 TaxID=1408161 RepID=A0A6A7B3V3_9PLEO|nr:hypothetical protein T440DRAFT_397806 [Plenodomus tracheiphilus IPT5]
MDHPPRNFGRGGPPNNNTRGTHTPRGHPPSTRRGRGSSRGRPRGSTFNTLTGTFTPPPQSQTPTHPLRPRQESHTVPPHRSIHPSTPVSIILKADQATGHRVHGIVADLLTRGDHPRGVKVRLRDGRVGRVQALISEAEGQRGEALVGGVGANLGRVGENAGALGGARGGGGMVGGRIERDIRDQDEYLYDEGRQQASASLGLFAALEDADRGPVEAKVKKGETTMATCPVCGEFEGDEAAVAHHVEEHFGS